MKNCPTCKTPAFDDATVCFGCLQRFEPQVVLSASPRNPERCPLCGSSSIEGDSTVFDRNRVYQRMSCGNCGFHWSDTYEYADYIPLN